MKSTWNYFKGRIRRRKRGGATATAAAPSVPGEWDEEAPPPQPPLSHNSIECKNRRVTDGSLITCLGSDASALAEKTRLSHTRAWRFIESRWWQSGCQATAEAAAESSSFLLPSTSGLAVSADLAAQSLLKRRSASDEDFRRSRSSSLDLDDFNDNGCRLPRRNSLSELDENVGSDVSPEAWAVPATADRPPASFCPTANLLDIGEAEDQIK